MILDTAVTTILRIQKTQTLERFQRLREFTTGLPNISTKTKTAHICSCA
ncbi:hypothetical protein K5Q02_13140 [Pseudomonas sp. MM211]|nr:hypothetical protein [Pseudomonas sp. MM211]UCJ14820.1 hypothetical protein K5Q02_13140 [Pseudomonas sp. MM211]